MTTPVNPTGARICRDTGLALIPTNAIKVTRIQKVSWGPMNPPLREDAVDPASWGRYDVANHRTIYAGLPAESAYAESLATQRISLGISSPKLSDIFSDEDTKDSASSILEAIKQEWEDLHSGFSPRKIVFGWRDARLEYSLKLPFKGWMIDIEAMESVATINSQMRATLADLGLTQLTTGDLRGTDRKITTAIAEWLHGRVLDDGSHPHGIYYGSKHGSDLSCWAIWLRRIDDGHPQSSEPTKLDHTKEIEVPHKNPPLSRVARLFDLTIF